MPIIILGSYIRTLKLYTRLVPLDVVLYVLHQEGDKPIRQHIYKSYNDNYDVHFQSDMTFLPLDLF